MFCRTLALTDLDFWRKTKDLINQSCFLLQKIGDFDVNFPACSFLILPFHKSWPISKYCFDEVNSFYYELWYGPYRMGKFKISLTFFRLDQPGWLTIYNLTWVDLLTSVIIVETNANLTIKILIDKRWSISLFITFHLQTKSAELWSKYKNFKDNYTQIQFEYSF